MKKHCILVIDDEEDILSLVTHRLMNWGYLVTAASDGERGLEAARQFSPDLVILDLMLPKLSGEEVCKAIREDKNKKFAGTPIIMLTAKTSDTDRVIGKVVGANEYITKPFDSDFLLSKINQILTQPTETS